MSKRLIQVCPECQSDIFRLVTRQYKASETIPDDAEMIPECAVCNPPGNIVSRICETPQCRNRHLVHRH